MNEGKSDRKDQKKSRVGQIQIHITVKDQIVEMKSNGYTEQDICKRLKLKKKTFDRYVEHLTQETSTWLRSLAKDGYVLNYRQDMRRIGTGLSILDARMNKIKEHILEHPEDEKYDKILANIIPAYNKLIDQHWNMLNKAPMVESFRVFVQENIIEGKPAKSAKETTEKLTLLP